MRDAFRSLLVWFVEHNINPSTVEIQLVFRDPLERSKAVQALLNDVEPLFPQAPNFAEVNRESGTMFGIPFRIRTE